MDGGMDRGARTQAIMSKFENMPSEQPQDAGADVIAAEDIKAGEKIKIQDGMAYCATPKQGMEKPEAVTQGKGEEVPEAEQGA